ncbi:MAG TPA: hypothetical protein VLT45_00090, partial [Kofleriaceae bacterium]|nr:hypothetical protein [Kofleriaceae bacterium]
MDPILAAMQRQLESNFDATTAALSAAAQSGVAAPGRVLGATPGAQHQMAIDPTSVHVNQPLANVLVYYKNNRAIADGVMPVVPVEKQSDVYFVYATSTAFDLAKTDVAGQLGKVAEVSLVPSNSPYACTNHALRDWVPVQTVANSDSPIQVLAHTEKNLADKLTLAREFRVAQFVFSNTNYGANHTALAGGTRWDTSTGTPVLNTRQAIDAILVNDELIGVYGAQVWSALMTNAEVKSFITGRPSTQLGATPLMMSEDTWSKAFDLRATYVGKMRYNGTNDGTGAPAYSYIWGKSAAILHVPATP